MEEEMTAFKRNEIREKVIGCSWVCTPILNAMELSKGLRRNSWSKDIFNPMFFLLIFDFSLVEIFNTVRILIAIAIEWLGHALF